MILFAVLEVYVAVALLSVHYFFYQGMKYIHFMLPWSWELLTDLLSF